MATPEEIIKEAVAKNNAIVAKTVEVPKTVNPSVSVKTKVVGAKIEVETTKYNTTNGLPPSIYLWQS